MNSEDKRSLWTNCTQKRYFLIADDQAKPHTQAELEQAFVNDCMVLR